MIYGANASAEISITPHPQGFSPALWHESNWFGSANLFNLDRVISPTFFNSQNQFLPTTMVGMKIFSTTLFENANLFGTNVIAYPTPQVAFSKTLPYDSGDGSGWSVRNLCTLAYGGDLIRVTFKARSNVNWVIGHASIGIQDTTYNSLSTPVELLFSGSSGTTVSAGQTVTSDWLSFTTTVGQTAIVIADTTTGGWSYYNPGSGTGGYYKAATASYNQSAPSGSWTTTDATNGVSQIEVE